MQAETAIRGTFQNILSTGNGTNSQFLGMSHHFITNLVNSEGSLLMG